MRPSTYTTELGKEICRRIADGETLLQITGPKRRRGYPARATVYEWLIEHADFRVAYGIARLAQVELLAEQVIAIADGVDELGAPGPREVARDRLRVEARRWLASVMAPHVYERLAELGADRAEVSKPLDMEHAAAKIAAILEIGRKRRDARLAAEARGEPPPVYDDIRRPPPQRPGRR